MLVCLLLTAAALAVALYRADARHRAPFLPDYDWSKHSDVLLVVYPLADACSTCNLSISGWAERGLKSGLDVVVVAARSSLELQKLRKTQSQARLAIITGVDEATIKRFSSGDKIGGVRVRNGRIAAQQLGGAPSKAFLQPFKS